MRMTLSPRNAKRRGPQRAGAIQTTIPRRSFYSEWPLARTLPETGPDPAPSVSPWQLPFFSAARCVDPMAPDEAPRQVAAVGKV
jgi:hypothetical protein